MTDNEMASHIGAHQELMGRSLHTLRQGLAKQASFRSWKECTGERGKDRARLSDLKALSKAPFSGPQPSTGWTLALVDEGKT